MLTRYSDEQKTEGNPIYNCDAFTNPIHLVYSNYIKFIVDSDYPPSTELEKKVFLQTTLTYIFSAAFYFAVGMGLFYITYTTKDNEPVKPDYK